MLEETKIELPLERLQELQRLLARYPDGQQKSALIPLLHIAQAEFGWLSPQVMDYVARLLDLQPVEVYEVASFYSMFHLKPMGKCVLEVCHTGPCAIVGAENIIDYLSKKLNIKPGETTTDGMFSLKTVECLGSCGTAPMLQCGADYHENLTPDKVDALLDKLATEGVAKTYC